MIVGFFIKASHFSTQEWNSCLSAKYWKSYIWSSWYLHMYAGNPQIVLFSRSASFYVSSSGFVITLKQKNISHMTLRFRTTIGWPNPLMSTSSSVLENGRSKDNSSGRTDGICPFPSTQGLLVPVSTIVPVRSKCWVHRVNCASRSKRAWPAVYPHRQSSLFKTKTWLEALSVHFSDSYMF